MTLYKSVVLILGTSLLLLLTGCPSGNNGNTTKAVGDRTAPGESELPVEISRELATGGVLRLPLEIDVDDPAIANLDFTVPQLWALARAIEAPVVGKRVGGTGHLGLAVVEQVSGSGKHWTLKVISVKESAGSPVEISERVIEHWKDILSGGKTPLRAQMIDLVEGAADFAYGRALDVSGLSTEAESISITLTREYHNFSSWMTQPGLGLVNRGELPHTGYGPFILSAVEGNELVLIPNADYSGDQPVLDELRFVCEPDRERQVEMFRAGELDTANILPQKAARIANDKELNSQLVTHETAGSYLGVFNYSHFPWDDGEFQSRLGLRQAMNWGIDRETLGTMLNDQITPWPHFLPKAYEKFVDPADIQQPIYSLTAQIEDARAGLRLADHDQGIRLPTGMDCAFLTDDNVEQLTVTILEFWNEVSVKMGPFSEPRETLYERIDNGHHEIIIRPVRPAYPGPDGMFYPLLHGELTGLGGNWSMIDEEEINSAIEDAMSEADPISLQLKYHQIGHELEARSLFVFIGYGTPSLLINQRLGGYELSPADYDASLNNQDFAGLGFYVE